MRITIMLQRFRILFLCIFAACVYGILHDQITAHICVEYFLPPSHPVIFGGSENPTVLAFQWGVAATWWVGFFLGFPLSLCCTLGDAPRITAGKLLKPLAVTLGTLALLAFLTGLSAYFAARQGHFPFDSDFSDLDIPGSFSIPFATVHATHLASYGFGGILGIALCVWALRTRYHLTLAQRRRPSPASATPQK